MTDEVIKELYALCGIKKLEHSITRLLSDHTDGLTNAEIAEMLGLCSSHNGQQKNYLTYSILGNMMEAGIVKKIKVGSKAIYVLNEVKDIATNGYKAIENSIKRLLNNHTEGLTNTEIADILGLNSSIDGEMKNYLTYSVLGNMMAKKTVEKIKIGAKTVYKLK